MLSQHVFKVITGGDGGVGKTTLLHRYVEGKFLADTRMTVGVEFFRKSVSIGSDTSCQLLLWDFAGGDQFRFMIKNYVIGAVGALILIDLTRLMSLKNISTWIEMFRSENPNLPILLVGSKLDLEDQITVRDSDLLRIKEEYNLFDCIKTSSKTGYNVNEAFERITREILAFKDIDFCE